MLPPPDTIDWIYDSTEWWIGSFGGSAAFQKTPLFLPTAEFFPVDTQRRGEALADAYFMQTALNAGVAEWPFVLEDRASRDMSSVLKGLPHNLMPMKAQSEDPELIHADQGYPVSYELSQLDDPVGLVATFARNIAHYHLYAAATPMPSDDEQRPYFTDLAAVLLGFGVFLTNSAFQFAQHSDGLMSGWGVSRQGALSELDLSYALALFIVLRDLKPRPILKLLTANPRGFVKSALKDIRRHRKDEVALLARVASLENGPYR